MLHLFLFRLDLSNDPSVGSITKHTEWWKDYWIQNWKQCGTNWSFFKFKVPFWYLPGETDIWTYNLANI